MDLVNFQVGAKTVALPILNILLTERYNRDLTDIPNDHPSFLGIKDFCGSPVPVFDLGHLLNHRTSTQTKDELIRKLQECKRDLTNWLDEIRSSEGTTKASLVQLPAYLWLAEFKANDEDLQVQADKLTVLLDQVIQRDPRVEPDCRAIEVQVSRQIDACIDSVASGHKPILVFTTTDGTTAQLGLLVDKVTTSLQVDESEIKRLDSVLSQGFELTPQVRNMMKGLVQSEDSHSLIISPEALFEDENTRKRDEV